MSANVTNPALLTVPGGGVQGLAETITKPSAAATLAHRFYTRGAAFPAASGFAAGVSLAATSASEMQFGIQTEGYAIVQVAPTVSIAVDGAVATNAAGQAIPYATGTILGRAIDSSTGGGTTLAPHYIVILLGAN